MYRFRHLLLALLVGAASPAFAEPRCPAGMYPVIDTIKANGRPHYVCIPNVPRTPVCYHDEVKIAEGVCRRMTDQELRDEMDQFMSYPKELQDTINLHDGEEIINRAHDRRLECLRVCATPGDCTCDD
jgi:hypothetical protein